LKQTAAAGGFFCGLFSKMRAFSAWYIRFSGAFDVENGLYQAPAAIIL
jgi:hypothetical protein